MRVCVFVCEWMCECVIADFIKWIFFSSFLFCRALKRGRSLKCYYSNPTHLCSNPDLRFCDITGDSPAPSSQLFCVACLLYQEPNSGSTCRRQ